MKVDGGMMIGDCKRPGRGEGRQLAASGGETEALEPLEQLAGGLLLLRSGARLGPTFLSAATLISSERLMIWMSDDL